MSTPNMNLTVPIVSQTVGPTWANQINGDLSLIDAHDHTLGCGVPVPVAGLNINGNLSFFNSAGNFSVTDLESVQFYNQTTLASERSLYTIGDNLYYNTTGGASVQITNGTNVNAGAGSITGMTGGANVAFNPGTGAFTFEQSAGLPATLDVGTVIVRPQSIGSSGIEITAPAGASPYILTLPMSLPPSQVLMSLASNGDIIKLSIDASTLVYQTSTLLKVGVIGTANLGASIVTTAKIDNLAVTGEKLASPITTNTGGVATYTISGNGTWQSVYTIPATISLTTLRPLMIVFEGDGNGSVGGYMEASTTDAETQVLIYQNLTNITQNRITITNGIKYAPGVMSCIFSPTNTGTWTINLQVKQTSGSSTVFKNVKFFAYQI